MVTTGSEQAGVQYQVQKTGEALDFYSSERSSTGIILVTEMNYNG